jgi:hypothetical protein
MAIDSRSRTPIYVQLAELFGGPIRSGELLPGAMLPSEVRLSQEFGVSRDTARLHKCECFRPLAYDAVPIGLPDRLAHINLLGI